MAARRQGNARERGASYVAEAVARDLAIEEVHAEVVPEKNAEAIAVLKRGGHRVAMVGTA